MRSPRGSSQAAARTNPSSAAAWELPRGIRINLISPTVLTESVEAYDCFFPGFESVPAATVAQAYRRSVEGVQSGRVYKVGY